MVMSLIIKMKLQFHEENTPDYLLLLCFQSEPQTKADKIKLALEKLKEAKVRKVKSAGLCGSFTAQLHR